MKSTDTSRESYDYVFINSFCQEASPYLVLKETASEGPDTAEYKVQLQMFLGSIQTNVLRCEHTLEVVAESHHVVAVSYWCDLLEPHTHHLETQRDVLVKQDC